MFNTVFATLCGTQSQWSSGQASHSVIERRDALEQSIRQTAHGFTCPLSISKYFFQQAFCWTIGYHLLSLVHLLAFKLKLCIFCHVA